MEEFKTVDFEKDELEYWNISKVIAGLPFLAYQDSNSNAKINFMIFWNEQFYCSEYLSMDTLIEDWIR